VVAVSFAWVADQPRLYPSRLWLCLLLQLLPIKNRLCCPLRRLSTR